MKTISVKDTRNFLAEIIETVNITGEKVVITKFGKPKAIILPYSGDEISTENREKIILQTSGMWEDYKVQDRKQSRHEKIFD